MDSPTLERLTPPDTPEGVTTVELHEMSTDKTYRVDSYPGIAWYYRGPEMEVREDNRYWEDEDGRIWEDEEPEETETGWARMTMVGDDRVFTIEPCDISELSEDAYCWECGQIGCSHGMPDTGEDDSPNPLDLFDAASYPEPSMYDVAGAYQARLNEGMEEIGVATRKLREFEPTLEEGEDPMGLWGVMGPIIKEVCNRPIKPIAIG